MADLEISQAEADALIAMEKHRADAKESFFPEEGGRLAIALTSTDNRRKFHARHHLRPNQIDKGDLSKQGSTGDYSYAA
jgi:fatty acid desaturase